MERLVSEFRKTLPHLVYPHVYFWQWKNGQINSVLHRLDDKNDLIVFILAKRDLVKEKIWLNICVCDL